MKTSKYCVSMLLSKATASLLSWNSGGIEDRSAHGYAPNLSIENATLTTKWVEGSYFTQIIEMFITNSDKENYLTLADTLKVTVVSDSLKLVSPGTLTRLAPNQSALVQVGVRNKAGVARGTSCSATVLATYGQKYGPAITTNQSITGFCGLGDYTATEDSVGTHITPDWYDDVKFGIFIHWGLYSAPAYGSVSPNEDYAEWYWYRMHDPDYRTHTYQYHLQTYGEHFEYDKFMSNFTATGFKPKAWVDLIAAAGARYMVPVTKHHDGFALFDFPSTIGRRSSVHYGPKRDLIGELLAAAKKYQPQIRRGTYFSMPEWYNPAYVKYSVTLGGNVFGAEPTNPYTNETIPYTGYVEINDFVKDFQRPQMEQLAYSYDTELMWCDIGGANDMTGFASAWLNWARKQGRQVTFNNRCGIQGDFDTPEYTTNSGTVTSKWETNRGMDPFSFGYNYLTPDDEYLNATSIVQTLVDTVSKNGNFLLDIGPMHNGSIPTIMSTGLREAGSWVIPHGDSIFGTRYWSVTPGLGNFRYTTSQDAFYIHYMATPPSTLVITDPVPWLPSDTVSVLGGKHDGKVIHAQKASDGSLSLKLTDDIISGDKYVWTFKISYTSKY